MPASPLRVLHLVIGPPEHGVVRHAVGVAKACGDTLLQFGDARDVRIPTGFDVVHVPYTDRLFGRTAEAAADAFDIIAGAVLATGARLSTTLHDVPAGHDPLAERRRLAYRKVASRVSGLVVASSAEMAAVRLLGAGARSRCVIALPVEPAPAGDCAPTGSSVAVLGFVYPDRGYEQVIAALPHGMNILALGRAADGHDELPRALSELARAGGHGWRLTGFLSDEALSLQLRTVAVPVAPNRRTGASASIATWLAHGRRPLVPVSAYTRELAEHWPDTLWLYDPDDPEALTAAIAHAFTNPASTLLRDGVKPGPDEDDVARQYRAHFQACAAPEQLPAKRRLTVPDNRWDLLAGHRPEPAPTVSVVIPYFNAPDQLRLVLHALTLQTHPATRLEIIIADDGSSQPPVTDAAGDLPVRVVRQADLGFRAAAARNLGAAQATGEVLLFLDADTVPEPDYVTELARLPALTAEALVVGRRRHADLRGWSTGDLTSWFCREGQPPVELTEPQWLRDGYAASQNLLEIDARSYRYVISAVLGITRELFDEIGGFCEEFTSYGGEDWELAHRAYCAGALFAHVPAAVAWHDGPEWAERAVDRELIKAAETKMLNRLLPDPVARGAGQWLPYPAVVIQLDSTEPCEVRRSADSAFSAGVDCGIWLSGRDAARIVAQLDDLRIQALPVPVDALQRCLFLVDAAGGVDLSGLPGLLDEAAGTGEVRTPHVRVRTTRAISRERRRAIRGWSDLLA